MVAMDLGQPGCKRAIDVDRNRPHLVQREELLQAVNHALGAGQAERRDHDLALQADRPRDDGVQLLDQPIVGIELAIAVSAFRHQDVDILDHRRIGKEVRVPPAQVAGEDKPPRPPMLVIVELHERRAEDVTGIFVSQGHARNDLLRLIVRHAPQTLDDPLNVNQVEQGLERSS